MATASRLSAEEAVKEDNKSERGTKSSDIKIPRSTEVSKAAAVAEVMIAGNAVKATEVKILTLTLLEALSVTCSERARSSKRLEILGTEEKKMLEKEKKKKKKKKKGQRIFPQDQKEDLPNLQDANQPKKETGTNGSKKMPAEKIPHQNSSFLSLQSSIMPQKKNTAAQQISSARLDKIKELQNEIFDLQHKIEASRLENRALKQLQCRQLKEIDRYENSANNLPDLLASHCNEVRSLKKLLKMSQEDERSTSRKLRKVEAELLKAKDTLQALHMLSEDKALAEREELSHRLLVLKEKMEVNDRRIQSLEKQLKSNNSNFSHQLAIENKKAVEAAIITKSLRMEINSLQQKIKEKDRQLYIKNIYANRMPKIPKDNGDSVPQEQSVSINRSVQVDKEGFRSLLLSQSQTQEKKKSPVQLTKEKTSSEDKNQKAKTNEAYADAQGRTKKQSTKKVLKPETFNRTCREYLREGRPLMEEYVRLEFMKEEKEADLLKQELKQLKKTEQTSRSDRVKENSKEEGAVEEFEKEGKKPDEKLNNSEKTGRKCVTPGPKNKTLVKLKEKHIFSGATENLHHELRTSDGKCKKGSLRNRSHAGQDCGEKAESEVKNSFGVYEPSFGKVTKTRQKDSSSEAEGCAHMTSADRKNSLMKELFGPGCV